MSNITVSVGMTSVSVQVSSSSASGAGPNFRYWYDGTLWWREGVRSGIFVRDYFKTGGNLTLFKRGLGTANIDYINSSEES